MFDLAVSVHLMGSDKRQNMKRRWLGWLSDTRLINLILFQVILSVTLLTVYLLHFQSKTSNQTTFYKLCSQREMTNILFLIFLKEKYRFLSWKKKCQDLILAIGQPKLSDIFYNLSPSNDWKKVDIWEYKESYQSLRCFSIEHQTGDILSGPYQGDHLSGTNTGNN